MFLFDILFRACVRLRDHVYHEAQVAFQIAFNNIFTSLVRNRYCKMEIAKNIGNSCETHSKYRQTLQHEGM